MESDNLDYEKVQELWDLGYSDEEISEYFYNCFSVSEIKCVRKMMGIK